MEFSIQTSISIRLYSCILLEVRKRELLNGIVVGISREKCNL